MEVTKEMYKAIVVLTESVMESLKQKGSITNEELITWKTKLLESNAATPEELSIIHDIDGVLKFMKHTVDTMKIDYFDKFVADKEPIEL